MSHSQHVAKYRCIETIAPKSDWLVKIGCTCVNLNYLKNEDVWNRSVSERQTEEDAHSGIVKRSIVFSNHIDKTQKSLYEIIEEDPIASFEYIQRNCLSYSALITRIPIHLSGRTLDKLCNKIFSKQDVDPTFVELFYESFFSLFLMRPYTWFSLHLLIKASKAYPKHFETTWRILLRERYITSTVLQDFVGHISEEDCTNLMKLVIELQFPPEIFERILPILYTLYTKSAKTNSVFQFMLTNLELCSEFCANNKNYGMLLLYFVQNISGHDFIYKDIKRIIEQHCTPYKMPCLAALDKHVSEAMAIEMNFPEEEHRIIIPRPRECFQL